MARNHQKHRSRETSDDTTRKSVEEMGKKSADILTLSTRAAERSVQPFSGLGQDPREAVKQSARSMEVLQGWGHVLGVGYQDISREYVKWLQSQLQTNMSSLSRLIRCRTAEQLIAVQNQLFGENIALALTVNRRVAEISKETADRMAEKITELEEPAQGAKDPAD